MNPEIPPSANRPAASCCLWLTSGVCHQGHLPFNLQEPDALQLFSLTSGTVTSTHTHTHTSFCLCEDIPTFNPNHHNYPPSHPHTAAAWGWNSSLLWSESHCHGSVPSSRFVHRRQTAYTRTGGSVECTPPSAATYGRYILIISWWSIRSKRGSVWSSNSYNWVSVSL